MAGGILENNAGKPFCEKMDLSLLVHKSSNFVYRVQINSLCGALNIGQLLGKKLLQGAGGVDVFLLLAGDSLVAQEVFQVAVSLQIQLLAKSNDRRCGDKGCFCQIMNLHAGDFIFLSADIAKNLQLKRAERVDYICRKALEHGIHL